MQDEGYSSPVGEQDAQIDRAVLALLLSEYRGLWSADEVAREIGNEIEVKDSLARLHGGGLIHRLEDFVFPTVAAVQAARIDG